MVPMNVLRIGMYRKGQIFVQDACISFFISVVTILMLISFVNSQVAGFSELARKEHMLVAGERIIEKMLLTSEYGFNTGRYRVNDGFLAFIERLNDEDAYEKFREENTLSREGVAYDVGIIADCGAKGIAKGGVFGDRPVITTALANNGNVICNVRVWVSQR
ncbi:MAG: hypothetical protein ACP5H8_01650 [Candidatus Micrarchaeia archaeon]